MLTLARGPTATIFEPVATIDASARTAPPLTSTTVAPTMASEAGWPATVTTAAARTAQIARTSFDMSADYISRRANARKRARAPRYNPQLMASSIRVLHFGL